MSIHEPTNLDLEGFDFEEFLFDDELLRSFDNIDDPPTLPEAKLEREAQRVGSKRKESSSHSTTKPQVKRGKKKEKTVIQLPAAVRSTEFAHYMIDGRFKMRPVAELLETPEMKLYSFPSFNRCDALTYFPSSLVSFINNGDVSAISELFNSFFHRNCEIRVAAGLVGLASQFLEFQHLMNDMHPDQILCVRSTKKRNNEIRADVYFKVIENKTIYESVARTNLSSFLAPVLVASRAEHVKEKFTRPYKSDEEMRALTELLNSEAEVELSGRIDMRMVLNKHSLRVLEFKMLAEITGFRRIDMSNALLLD